MFAFRGDIEGNSRSGAMVPTDMPVPTSAEDRMLRLAAIRENLRVAADRLRSEWQEMPPVPDPIEKIDTAAHHAQHMAKPVICPDCERPMDLSRPSVVPYGSISLGSKQAHPTPHPSNPAYAEWSQYCHRECCEIDCQLPHGLPR